MAAEGATLLARSCRVLVVMDVLRFTTAAEIAVSQGGPGGAPAVAGARGGGSRPGRSRAVLPLSPVSLLGIPAGTRLELASPNGATVTLAVAGAGAVVLAGCLRNASAVAARAAIAMFAGGLPSTVVACASGRELAARGLAADLDLAAKHDVSQALPRLLDGAFAQLSWPG